jgi:hypothetical protein
LLLLLRLLLLLLVVVVAQYLIRCIVARLIVAEETFDAAMQELVSRGFLGQEQLVALVMSGRRPIWRSASTHSIQVCHGVQGAYSRM